MNQQVDSKIECYYCGKPRHKEKVWQKRRMTLSGKLPQSNYASAKKKSDDRNDHLFVMQHMVNSTIEDVLHCANVQFVYSGVYNHITSHGEWFSDVKNLEKLDYVKTSNDTVHPIAQVGKVPPAMKDGITKYLLDVIHVSNITKNMVSIVGKNG